MNRRGFPAERQGSQGRGFLEDAGLEDVALASQLPDKRFTEASVAGEESSRENQLDPTARLFRIFVLLPRCVFPAAFHQP